MRVLIDTTYARRAPHSGTGVYINRLCDELSGTPGVEILRVFNPARLGPPAGGGIGSVRNLLADLRWAAVQIPRLATRLRGDLIHLPLPAPVVRAPCPHVVTVVDLAFERLPFCFDLGFRTYAHVVHRMAALSATRVIAISETTARDASELWGVGPERMSVAHLGPGQELEHAPVEGHRGPFVYVGDAEPRKDLGTLLAAHSRYRRSVPAPLELVLAGSVELGEGWPGVRVERSPDPDRLAELLVGATALVHPSRYEGFGLTPLEAMGLGAPVLAASSPGVLEVCADAAVYFAPGDVRGLTARLTQVGEDDSLRERLAAAGRERVENFSWERCARAHLDAYSLALGG